MSRKKKTRPQRRNATEYLYNFTGFLTTRDKPLIFSSHHDAAPIAEMVAAYVKENKMPGVRPNWPGSKRPKNTDHLTNEPSKTVKDTTPPPPPTPAEAVRQITRILLTQSTRNQGLVLASLLEQAKGDRQARIDQTRRIQFRTETEALQAQDEMDQLERVMRGDVSIFYTNNNGSNG